MPKSKEFIESSDESGSEGSGEGAAAATVSKKPKAKVADSKNEPPMKKTKTNDEDDGAPAAKKGPGGERLYELGKLRYVSVSEFRGKSLINIREYYEDKGVEKPGKKGISLSVDQWEKLKSLVNQVDKDLKKFK